MTKKIPFKISARTARLIGRQNFPNSEGAIIELIKNCYDADASMCILFFDNKYSKVPLCLEKDVFEEFNVENLLLSSFFLFDKKDKNYKIIENFDKKENFNLIQELFHSKCKLHIIEIEKLLNELRDISVTSRKPA